MTSAAVPSRLIADFETRCVAVGVKPTVVLKNAGIHPTLWSKWRDGRVSPTLRNFEAAEHELCGLEVKVRRDDAAVSRNRQYSFPGERR